MDKIKDILQLDLTEDIKDVIDLEDRSEEELQFEIENYIVTSKIAKYLGDFISFYQSNIKETGVWLSGFYGSGKSYFGKMLGYLLENRIVNGTPFQERYIQRLAGLPNRSLLENAIRRLSALDIKVVFLDIAKQNTKNGFAWTLFKNFLSTLGFLDDVFGYMEYGLFLEGKYDQFITTVEKVTGNTWQELRKNPINVTQTFRNALTESLYTQEEYLELKKYVDQRITSYDAAKFKDELLNYLLKYSNQRIVFLIDEVSEAIAQKKIDLLELEGTSEALSAITLGKVWTIAIAQEKLEDVIQNANVSVKELSKVIDRFKTRIHLSSEEVDMVIRKRLLLKTEDANQQLQKFYNDNSGLIIDSTSLNAKIPTKSDDLDDFIIYYPFHKYHIHLLQNFLFSVHKRAKTGGSERGMIIATHAILKNLMDNRLFAFVAADNLVDGGQKVLESELERKYNQADKVLTEQKSTINGTKLLKTIYFLNESNSVVPTSENITKLYLDNLIDYYKVKPFIDKALAELCKANLLLEKNGVYKITSDLEQKLIDEMKNINVEFHYKKRELIEQLRKQSFISDLSKCMFEDNHYNFSVESPQGDELVYSKNKHIKIQLPSPYTVEEEKRNEYIEKTKFETQANTELATLVPSMDHSLEIDNLIEEIYRYGVLEDRYKNDDDEKIRGIIKDFSINKSNRIRALNSLIEKAYKSGNFIYHFEENELNENTFSKVAQEIQEKIIRNTYPDRLPFQLPDDRVLKILKETNPKKLKTYFSGKEFEFFNGEGIFIGDNLRVVEKIVFNISSIYKEGAELENSLSIPPYDYSFGTISTVLAVLIRAGKLSVKYNGRTIYDYKDEDILNVFGKSREFKKAAFKAIVSTLQSSQKKQLVECLKKLKTETILDRTFGYGTNDIELVSIVSSLAEYFIQKVDAERRRNADFDSYFPGAAEYQSVLAPFAVKITDVNYKGKAEEFMSNYESFKEAVEQMQEIIAFIEKKLTNVERFRSFITHITTELDKLGGKYKDNPIFALEEEFTEKFNESVVNHYVFLEQTFQKIKDNYHSLMKEKHQEMSDIHGALKKQAENAIRKVKKVSEELNKDIITELTDISTYAKNHSCDDLKIEYEIACQNCHYSLNEIITANQSIELKRNKIDQLLPRIQYPSGGEKKEPRKISLTADTGEFTVEQYRKKLQDKLDRVKNLKDDDIVVVK